MEEKENSILGAISINNIDIPCKLILDNIKLTFEPVDPEPIFPEPISVSLVGLLESKIIPHPSLMASENMEDIEGPYTPVFYIITYLPDLFNLKNHETITFTGMRFEVQSIKDKLEKITSEMKQSLHFIDPRLNTAASNKQNTQHRPSHKFELHGGPSEILTEAEIESLRLAFPIRFQLDSWELLFTTSTHGTSIESLYRLCGQKKPLILLIKCTDGGILGSFIVDGLKETHGFYGGGETFVFSFNPLIGVYKWTQANNNIIATSHKDFIIGSSTEGESSAIYFDSQLYNGFSNECATFDSPVLSKKPAFQIQTLEVWHTFKSGL